MTMAPAMAPASGRARNRASGDLRPTRSSVLGGGATGASAVVAMNFPFCCSTALAGATLGVLGHRVDVAAVDEGRTGEHGRAAAEGVAVGQEQPQGVDRLITLQVRLLVNGPLDLAGLDLGDLGRAGGEGVVLGRGVGLRTRPDGA